MKPRTITPTDQERILPADRYILSTSDLSGRITSVNDLFIEFSGHPENDLLATQHNIVRHPDMPRAVYSIMWDAIKDGDEFSGYIKNISKDGGFYWVYAHVLPITDAEGDLTGYRSVRHHASRTAIAKVAALYAEMLAAEKAAGPQDAIGAGLAVLRRHLAAAGMGYEQFIAHL